MYVYVNDAQACRRFQRGSLRTGAQQLCNIALHSTVQRRCAVRYCKELEAILNYTKNKPTQTHPDSPQMKPERFQTHTATLSQNLLQPHRNI